jgi:DNA-binding transcriptional ArsR family regulator
MPRRKSPAGEAVPDAGARTRPLRRLDDPTTMRALAHPVRLDLLEALLLEGELTATQAAHLIGESPASCSFHLRQLAKYDFVEEAGGGKGRERPWRLRSIGSEMYPDDGDAETALAAGELRRMYFDRAVRRLHAWWAAEHAFPAGWRRATGANSTLWWVTLEELEAINKQVLEQLLFAYRERLEDPSLRPPGALPVEFVTFAAPARLTPPAEGAEG